MRKILLAIAVVIGTLTIASCSSCSNPDSQFGIEYALNSEGKTDGSVTVQVVVADFTVTGDAEYKFDLSSKKFQEILTKGGVKSLDEALESEDSKELAAANKVNSWLDEMVKVIEADGHYDVYVRGYVMETFTGLKFEIDKHFTNYPDPNEEPEVLEK